jgi:chemotaxis family two-component system response regulator Rcp1
MYRETLQRAIEILLVEDNEADARLVRMGLAESAVSFHISAVADGEEALRFLRKEGEYASAPQPDLMILDLNLPGKSGFDVLVSIKESIGLKRIPVLILTSSKNESDVNTAYDYGANAYMKKPTNLDDIFQLMKGIENYWLHLTVLPSHRA